MGYFFTSKNKSKLEKVAEELKNQNFEFVEIFEGEDKSYWLHLERVEKHNLKSLYELDEELYKIADKYKIEFDGFDAGNIEKGKAIEENTYFVPEEFKTTNFLKDNYPFLLVGNTAFDQFLHKEEFCYFIKIKTTYEKDEKALLPSDKEFDTLNDFELYIENTVVRD